MICANNFYEGYVHSIKAKIAIYEKRRDHLIDTHLYLIKKLLNSDHCISNVNQINFETIISTNVKEVIYSVPNEITEKAVDQIIKVNRIIYSCRSKILELRDKILDKKIHTDILKIFNTKIADRLIREGYDFTIGHNIGRILIYKSLNSKKCVNWKESIIARKKLIAEGKLPFKITGYDENRQPTNNGGVEYLVYHNQDNIHVLRWEGSWQCPNKFLYKMTPTGTFLKTMNRYIEANPSVRGLYKRRDVSHVNN